MANEKTRVVQADWTVKLVERISAESQRSQEKNTAAHAKPATLYLCPQNKTPREDPEAFLVSLLELNEVEYSISVIDKVEEQLIRRVSVFSNIDEEEQVYYIEGITSDINQYSRLINQIEVYDNDAYNKYDKNLKDMLARMIE